MNKNKHFLIIKKVKQKLVFVCICFHLNIKHLLHLLDYRQMQMCIHLTQCLWSATSCSLVQYLLYVFASTTGLWTFLVPSSLQYRAFGKNVFFTCRYLPPFRHNELELNSRTCSLYETRWNPTYLELRHHSLSCCQCQFVPQQFVKYMYILMCSAWTLMQIWGSVMHITIWFTYGSGWRGSHCM